MSDELTRIHDLIHTYEDFIDQNFKNFKDYSSCKDEFMDFKETLLRNINLSPNQFDSFITTQKQSLKTLIKSDIHKKK